MFSETFTRRFWEKVEKAGIEACWMWRGSVNQKGYGQIQRGNRGLSPILAHRASWIIHNGTIPGGLFVCHRCDIPACVNPEHLYLGTAIDNVKDMDSKGRGNRPILGGEKSPHAKLSKADVVSIRRNYAGGSFSQRALARIYGVHQATIYCIVRGHTWKQD